MRPLKICIISTMVFPSPPTGYGGLERVCYDLVYCLNQMGNIVTLIAPRGSQLPEGVELIAPCDPGFHNPEVEAYNAYRDRLGEFDIIHGHSWSAPYYLYKMDNPGAKVISTLHGMRPWGVAPPVKNPNLVGISKWHAQYISSTLGVPAEYVYNGIDIDTFKLCEQKEDYLLFVGRITPYKGPQEAIALGKRLGMKTIIVGEDQFVEDQKFVRQIMDSCNGRDAIYYGRVPSNSDLMVELMSHARCLVSPLLEPYYECFGLCFVEAMACGTPVVVTNRGCYTADVKALTPNGIRAYNELKVGDLVWTINPQNQLLEAQSIKRVIKYDYNGEILHYKSKIYDVRVTPEHRMLIKTQYNSPNCQYRKEYEQAMVLRSAGLGYISIAKHLKIPANTVSNWLYYGCKPKGYKPRNFDDFIFEKAKDTLQRYLFYIPVTAGWEGQDPKQSELIPTVSLYRTSNKLPEVVDFGDLLELAGWYIADGYTMKARNDCTSKTEVNFSVPNNDKYRNDLECLLMKMNLKFGGDAKTVWLFYKELCSFFDQFGNGAHQKHIPRLILELKPKYLQRLFDGIMKGDGCKQGDNFYALTTVSQKLSEDFVELCLKLGLNPRITYKRGKPGGYIGTRLITGGNFYDIRIRRPDGIVIRNRNIKKEHYKGEVWCVEVENGNFLVGRNGTFAFAGNSPSEIILQGKTGYVVDSVFDMDDAVKKIDKISPQACREQAEKFSRRAMAEGYLAKYQQILDGKEW